MNALLVGADTLGNIPSLLHEFDITIQRHLTGRNTAHQRKGDCLPAGIDLLILFTDFLGHNVMRHYRQQAAAQGIRFVACRRSVCALKQSLEQCGLGQHSQCATCPTRRH